MLADLRLALRRLASSPWHTLLLILIVATGIGAATTVFSIVDQLLLRPAPFADADRLVDVLDTNRSRRGGGNTLTPEKIAGWQQQPALFERFEGFAPLQFDITGGGEPERISGQLVTLGLFPMLGVEPRLGRSFTKGDGRPGADRVVIIGDGLWRRRFAADEDVLGKRVKLNDEEYTIVGVMSRRFRLLDQTDTLWLPIDISANLHDPALSRFYGIGRLARGIPFTSAQRMADDIADRLQHDSPLRSSWDLSLARKRLARVDQTTRTALFVLLGAVGFVLAITCANVATLCLSQWSLRVREMAVRAALGASRGRLIRAVLIETVLLAIAGGAFGIVLAGWGIDGVLAAAPPVLTLRTTSTIELDGRVMAIAVLATLATGVAIGLLPAIRGSKPDIERVLRGTSAAVRSAAGRAPSILIVIEVAFSAVLLVGAALMGRTLIKLEAITPGFEPKGLIAVHVDLPSDRYPTSESRRAFFASVLGRLHAVPGTSDAATATGVPPSQGGFTWGELEADGGAAAGGVVMVPINTVSPEYFQTLRIPLIAGRFLSASEPMGAVIISRGLAERIATGGQVVGRRYRIGARGDWRTVVGIVGNVESRYAGEDRTVLQEYRPSTVVATTAPATPPAAPSRRSFVWTLLIVRAQNPAAALPDIKRAIWAIDPRQPVERAALVTDLYAEAFGRQRFVLTLMSAFSAIALALTAAGLFGVLSQTVIRRTREIGIRVVLGAKPLDIIRGVVGRGVRLAIAGAALGTLCAFWLTATLRTLLFDISPTDPVSFAVVVAFLFGVSLAACWLPARAAMRIEPAVALRAE